MIFTGKSKTEKLAKKLGFTMSSNDYCDYVVNAKDGVVVQHNDLQTIFTYLQGYKKGYSHGQRNP